MDHNLTFVPLQSQDGLLDKILAEPAFAAIEAHPQSGRFGRAYYPAYWGERYRDYSFAMMRHSRPTVVVLCGMTNDVLGLHGLPMQMFLPDGLDPHVLTFAVKAAFERVKEIAIIGGAREICLTEPASAALTPIGEMARIADAKLSMTVLAMVDLTAGPAAWKQALRRRFRPFVNWGRDNFTVDYINSASPNLEKFNVYREFHAHIAGRVTRPKQSWDVQFEEISRGRGELILAQLDGKLVAGAMFIDGTEVTIYMNGVYDRELNKPLAHYVIWHGIERAHERGMRTFQLGDVHLPDVVDDKRHSIGYFKRGFATHFNANFLWTWPPSGSPGNEDERYDEELQQYDAQP